MQVDHGCLGQGSTRPGQTRQRRRQDAGWPDYRRRRQVRQWRQGLQLFRWRRAGRDHRPTRADDPGGLGLGLCRGGALPLCAGERGGLGPRLARWQQAGQPLGWLAQSARPGQCPRRLARDGRDPSRQWRSVRAPCARPPRQPARAPCARPPRRPARAPCAWLPRRPAHAPCAWLPRRPAHAPCARLPRRPARCSLRLASSAASSRSLRSASSSARLRRCSSARAASSALRWAALTSSRRFSSSGAGLRRRVAPAGACESPRRYRCHAVYRRWPCEFPV